MKISSTIFHAFLALTLSITPYISALPRSASLEHHNNPPTPRASSDECSFFDPFVQAPIPCDYFSIVFDHKDRTMTLTTSSTFSQKYPVICGKPPWPEGGWWDSFTSPLPYVLSVSPGNLCMPYDAMWQSFDNLVSALNPWSY